MNRQFSEQGKSDHVVQRVVSFGRRRSRPFVHESGESRATEAECAKCIDELNTQLAIFRDNVMHIAKPQDSPETRDRIRETRNKCVELCVTAHEMLMPQIRSDVSDGIPVDSQQLVNLVCCTQLLSRELRKCYHLIKAHPMDMTAFYERRPRSSGVAVLDMLVLWRPPPHDYHKEELHCITRDSDKAESLLVEMKEFMPVETSGKALMEDSPCRRIQLRDKRSFYRQFGAWFCFCRSNFG